jgi:hypothetical protein
MTKKNMIQEIQNQEAQLYLQYMQAAKLWGREDSINHTSSNQDGVVYIS